MGKTAAELMSELAKDKEYQAKKNISDAEFNSLKKMYASDEKLLVDELNKAGFLVGSIWDFVNSNNDYLGAESILIQHLKVEHHPKILAGLARSLAVPEFSDNDELWGLLSNLYSKTPSDSEISSPEKRGAQEAIAVALECLATKLRVESLREVIETVPHGDGVHWLKEKLKKLV